MIRTLAFIATLIMAPAFAQQPVPPTAQQRIGQQIGALVIENASLATQNEQLRVQLDAAAARIKELEAKDSQRAPK